MEVGPTRGPPPPQLQSGAQVVETLMMGTDDEQQAAWLREGVDNGWITAPFCVIHDGPPTSDEESDDDEYDDRCIYCVRLQD